MKIFKLTAFVLLILIQCGLCRADSLNNNQADLLEEYRLLTLKTDSLKNDNRQLEVLVNSQESKLDSIKQQFVEIEVINEEITPLMLKMVDSLEKFVALDLPFLPEERNQRITSLKDMMSHVGVTAAEKYRRIIEAYQVEMEYGRTIEAYRGDLGLNKESQMVNFLRVGRMSLIYQTLDGKQAGYWDNNARQWFVLDKAFQVDLAKALRIARKQAAPDLLRLPVSAPEVIE